jgi:hypothetical protein
MGKSYVLIQDFKAPYVIATGMPHKPSKIMLKKYVKGEIITGELKTAKGKPVIVLVSGVIPIPITVLKEVVTKEILNSANGTQSTSQKKINPNQPVVVAKKTTTRYFDAGILGAVLGVGAAYLAEKQGWIAQPDKKNKLYGAAIGAVLAMYLVYRKK